MRRTSPWIYVAGVAVQLAALGLCAWAMERWLGADARADAREPAAAPPPVPPAPDVPVPAAAPLFDVAAEEVGPVPPPPPPPANHVPPPAPEPHHVLVQHVAASYHLAEPPSAAQPATAPPPAAPRFGPPPVPSARPAENAVPRFVVGEADEGTQVLRGRVGEGSLVLGIAADGTVRCVDVDGARYSGKAESARARLREVDGSRAFTVQIGVDAGGALHASFTGGGHDGETIPLTPLVQGSAS